MVADPHTPKDDFPPFGYLDNPHHSWKSNPSGVLRSRQPSGMGWHFPNYGSYGRNQFSYRAHLHVGVEAAGVTLATPDDFKRAQVTIGCDVHTKNRLRYVWTHPGGVRVAAAYFLAGEDAIGCRIELTRAGAEASRPLAVRLWLAQEVAHNPATSRLWEHGLYVLAPGAREPETGAAGLVGVCPEGDAWAHGAALPGDAPLAPSAVRHEMTPWVSDKHAASREPGGLQTATLLLGYDLTLEGEAPVVVWAALARGVSADLALRAWRDALADFDAALGEHAAEDERFWSAAPRLAGDWPAQWRRGFATDFETLRMAVRPPSGVFKQPWDGMQIQAPRSVLAETALDALALSWADPEAAKGILLECFAAAPRPNVPCMREDGSYNMVADDGAICGTGPEWGWPMLVADELWKRTGDDAWLARLYPYTESYVEWWLANRTDAEGWAVHACSWESGQDVSTRFGEQSTGGSDVRHIRPVDLQAAMAQACELLAEWATRLGRRDEEATRWRDGFATWQARIGRMWHGGWFRDDDSRRGRWSDVRDPMQLAPLICGTASAEQAAMLRGGFDRLPEHCGVYPPLVWPPVAHTAMEAALSLGMDEWASERTASILERVWRRADAREIEPDGALPGVTREYWPEGGTETSAGIEGYGWGALTVHFLVRYLVGFREMAADTFTLAPALPTALRRPGASYTVGPLAYGAGRVTVTCSLPADALDMVDVALTLAGPWTRAAVAEDSARRRVAEGTAGGAADGIHLQWRGAWLKPFTVTVA